MLLIGHRGCKYPGFNQNTIRSFEKVTEEGVPAIEFDVQLSSDEQLVIVHNLSLEEVSTGTGNVCNTDSTTLKKLYAGDPAQGRDRIPFLPEVFDFFAKQPKEKRPAIHMELKGNNTGTSAGRLFMEYVQSGKLEISDMLCSSFNWDELHAFRKVCPTAAIALLEGAIKRTPLLEQTGANGEKYFADVFYYGNEEYMLPRFVELEKNLDLLEKVCEDQKVRKILEKEIAACLDGAYYTTELLTTAKVMNASSVNLWFQTVKPEFIKQTHKYGLKLFAYTVNEEKHIKNLEKTGVDGIFTDYYSNALRFLQDPDSAK